MIPSVLRNFGGGAYVQPRMRLAACVLLVAGLAIACTDGATPPSQSMNTQTSSAAGAPGETAQQPGPGWVEVRLKDYPVFIEGFDYGVRLTVDGKVVAERLLSDFTMSGEGLADREWTTRLEVAPGQATLGSDLSGSDGGGPPPPPTFEHPCNLSVVVASDITTPVDLDWNSGCLEHAA